MSAAQHPIAVTTTSVVTSLPRPLLAPLQCVEQGIEPGLSGGLTEGMHHYYWCCYLFPGVQQTCAKFRALEAEHKPGQHDGHRQTHI